MESIQVFAGCWWELDAFRTIRTMSHLPAESPTLRPTGIDHDLNVLEILALTPHTGGDRLGAPRPKFVEASDVLIW